MTVTDTRVAFQDLVVSRGGRRVLTGISGQVAAGEVVGLIGPNGAGKTTLLRAVLGLQPATGHIALGGRDLAALSAHDRALRAGYVPQDRSIAWPVTVRTAVALGRTPHRTSTEADAEAVAAAMQAMDVAGLADRRATDLSGGERARVLVARALAQGAPLLLADEPTAGLDPAHALGLMTRFRTLARTGAGVLVSLHDLGLAARWCDRLMLLDRGEIRVSGPPDTVLTPATLAQVYGVVAHHGRDEGGPLVMPTGLVGG